MTSEPDGRSLSHSASRGAVSVLVGQIGRIVVLLTGIVVLSRLLTPADYGLMAMITAVIGVAEVFRDFGLTSAAIQAKTLSRGEKTNLFWTGGMIGATLAVLVCLASWPLSWLYEEPRLQPITMVLALTFLFTGLTTQFTAELNRALKLGRLVAAEIAAQVIGLATGITLALLGFGVWALALQQVVQAFAALIIIAVASRWLPSWWARGVSVRSFIRYGAGVAGAQLLGYASRNVDSIAIGVRFGPTDLGLYNRAFQLMLLPLHQVNAPAMRVALPVLSRLQDEPARYKRYIVAGQFTLLLVVGGIIALCFAQAPAIIEVAIGHQWAESVPFFQILAIGGLFQAASTATYWAFLSKGLTGSQFRYSLVTRPVMIVLLIVGSLWSVEGVAWMYTLSLFLFWPTGLMWLARASDAPVWAIFWSGFRGVVVVVVAAAASWASTLWLGLSAPVASIAIGAVAVFVVYGLAILVVPGFRRDLVEVANQFKIMRKSRRERG